MNQEICFAVIIPVFNRSQSLTCCLNSIASQVVLPAQVIVIDDCSNEPYAAEISSIIENYTASFAINLFRLCTNSGPSIARNYGLGCMLEIITHVAYLDSDDTWHPRRLEVVAKLFRSHGADIVLNRYCLSNSLPEALHSASNSGVFSIPATILKPRQALVSNPCQTSCLAIRREVILPFPGNQRYCEDYSLILQALSANMKIVTTSLPLTILGRSQLSQGGLSSSLANMRLGELQAYLAYCNSSQRRWLFPFLAVLSVAKMAKLLIAHSYGYISRLFLRGI